jgi:hypothetical protein
MLTGAVLWVLYLSGRRLSTFGIMQSLLGSSLVFGTIAIAWIHARGLLPFAMAGYG